MEEKKFTTLLSIAIIPQVIKIIIEKEKMDEDKALNAFYESKTYDILADEESKYWHYSPLLLYEIWKKEMETGEVVFPED